MRECRRLALGFSNFLPIAPMLQESRANLSWASCTCNPWVDPAVEPPPWCRESLRFLPSLTMNLYCCSIVFLWWCLCRPDFQQQHTRTVRTYGTVRPNSNSYRRPTLDPCHCCALAVHPATVVSAALGQVRSSALEGCPTNAKIRCSSSRNTVHTYLSLPPHDESCRSAGRGARRAIRTLLLWNSLCVPFQWDCLFTYNAVHAMLLLDCETIRCGAIAAHRVRLCRMIRIHTVLPSSINIPLDVRKMPTPPFANPQYTQNRNL